MVAKVVSADNKTAPVKPWLPLVVIAAGKVMVGAVTAKEVKAVVAPIAPPKLTEPVLAPTVTTSALAPSIVATLPVKAML